MTNVIRGRVALLSRLLFTFSIAGLLAGTSTTALATFGELDITFPYVPLGDAGHNINGVTGTLHGLGNVKLSGWTFPFAKTTFNEVMVSTDGFLTLGSGKQVCGCTASLGSDTSCNNQEISESNGGEYEAFELGYACSDEPPTFDEICTNICQATFDPQFSPGLIMPFYNYDEEAAYETATELGDITYLQGGGPGAHYLIIDWNYQGSSLYEYVYNEGTENYSYQYLNYGEQYQAILFEGGAIVFTYGAQTPEVNEGGDIYEDPIEWAAGAYFPPPDGGMGITDAGLMLGPSKLYTNGGCLQYWELYGDLCYNEVPYENNWTELNPAYMGELDTPFLNAVPSPAAVAGAGGPTIDISVTVSNQGASPQAANFPIDFFLVKAGEPPYGLPSTCTGEATCLNSSLGPFSFSKAVASGKNVTLTAPAYALPSPLPPSGLYNVAAVIDPANTTVMSSAPLLEIGISSNTLAFGQDMTGVIQVTDFTPVKPGTFIVPLVFENLGLEEAISVPYELNFIGSDGSSTPGSPGTVYGVIGLSNEPVNQELTIPAGLLPGEYQLQLVIDAGIPTDLNLANNVILGIQHVINGQDMTASILSVPFSVASPITTPTDFTVPVTFHNLGLQPANGIPWTLFLTGANGSPFPVGTGTITLAGLSTDTEGLNAVIKTALPSGPYTLSLQIGPTSQGISPPTPDLNLANNTVFDTTPVYVYASSSDYAVGPGDLVLPGGGHAADGQVISVTRTIHNLEGPAGPCPYSYFLNPPSVMQVGDGVPVAILGPTGATYLGVTPSFGPYGEATANNTATDKIVIPAGMPVGPYNLVLALNPGNQIDDINPANNDTSVPMSLAGNPLQITSPSSLPAAIVDTPYVYVLQQTGASGDFTWSILAGSLPIGMALNGATGELSGSPTEPGVATLVIQLTAQGGTQVAVLQLPVAAGSGALQVEQSGASLPTAIVMAPYLQQLQAQGGVPPYTWKATIPSSLYALNVSEAGVLGGVPQEATDGPIQFTVIVTDAIGTTASQTLTLQVIAPGSLTITTPFLQPAVVGTQYDQPVLASDGTVTGATFNWSLSTQTTLPAGIQFQEIGTPAVADLSGVPTQAGIFPVVVNLSDNFGHSATRQYILTVAESPIPVPKQSLPAAIIGNGYAAQLQASSVSTLAWRLFSGQLPPGLSLAPTGAISGTVPVNTVTGGYPFSAAVSDANGAESVVALEIQVQLPAASGGGCATGTGPAAGGLLLLAMAWLSRRRRRWQGSALAAVGAVMLAAPAAFGQVPAKPCGTPPAPVFGHITYQDISTALGYQQLAAPIAGGPTNQGDVYSDYVGGTGGGECYYSGTYCYSASEEADLRGPFTQTYNLGTISLPFPFGFSGIYSDGGTYVAPFQVTVWANGLLTFDPSVSFSPSAYALNPVPSDCEGEGTYCTYNQMTEQDVCYGLPSPLTSGAASDTFGGFPFVPRLAPPPNALIAPWWGDLSICPSLGQVGWLSTLDDNNQPMAIIQWTNVTATRPEAAPPMGNFCNGPGDYSSCSAYANNTFSLYGPGVLPQFTFQVRLHANNDVDFIYGASSNFNPMNDCYDAAIGNCNYISGIQSNLVFQPPEPALLDYATQALNCDSVVGCLQSEFPPAGTLVTFSDVFRSIGPDLQLVAMNPPPLVPQGGTVTVPITLSNGGGTTSSEGQIQFYFSAGGTTPQGGAFSVQNVTPVPTCDTLPFPAQVTIPANAPEGGGYLIAEFVPGAESVDQRHTFASAQVVIGPPEPDLAVIGSLVFTPPAIVAGQDITINFQVANVGETDAPATAYGIYVSPSGGTISPTGNQIYGGVLPALASGSAPQSVMQSISIPLTLISGEYIIGVIVNPGNTLKEVNLANNVGLGKKLLDVTSPGPVITTTSLVDARANAPYSVQLVAGGGNGKYQWSLAAGALPGGLALTKAGLIAGQAESVGTSTFTIKVTDGTGHSSTEVLSISVDPFEQVLTIETVDLPAGSTGQLYNFTIAAIGGAPPYQWALVPSATGLPSGISLVSNGTLTGEPQYDGATSFQVTVTDSNGTVVTSPVYTLTVFAAGSLAVGSTQLPTAFLGKTYTGTLHYAGGTPPYTWTLISINREPGYPGDPGEDLGADISTIGLGFYSGQGQLEGVPTQVGVFAMQVQVTDGESPPVQAQGLVLLTVSSTTSFSFETVLLPPATVNQYYSTTLQTNAPASEVPNLFFQVINSAEKPSDTAKEALPPGLTLYSNGNLQDVPLLAGNYSFLVEATDGQGGVAIQSFSLQVTSAKAASSGSGCQSAPGAPALAGLLLLALTQVRRRSSRRRSES